MLYIASATQKCHCLPEIVSVQISLDELAVDLLVPRSVTWVFDKPCFPTRCSRKPVIVQGQVSDFILG